MEQKMPYVYVYATGRDDEWKYSVGIARKGEPVNGAAGLFSRQEYAECFANAYVELHGGTAEILPSAR